MNRGSAEPAPEAGALWYASMRPRFMNRGSDEALMQKDAKAPRLQ